MAVREFIGMRCVPIIGRIGEESFIWDGGAYEHLTIVMTEGGQTYMSRCTVPAGTPLTDTTYWAKFAEFNAQFALLQQTVETYNARITQAQTDANDAKLQVADADEIIAQLQGILEGYTEAGSVANAITTLDNKIDDTAQELNEKVDGEVATINQTIAGINEQIEAANEDIEINANNITSLREALGEFVNVRTGGVVMPSYIGDFVDDLQFASCCKVGNKMYTFSPSNWDSSGAARIFDMENNILLSKTNIIMGHANSCCYDSVRNRIWIAPCATYSNGVATDTNMIYYYNEMLTNMSTMELVGQTSVYGVSFDHVTNTLYAFTAYSTTGPLHVFAMHENENAFTEITTITTEAFDTSIATESYPFQDFAVYDNILYVVKPEGTAMCFDLADNNELVWTFRIGMSDIGGIWKYGEIEGIEFDASGRLYNARNALCGFTNSGMHYMHNCSFVTELNMPWRITQSDMSKQAVYGTLTINTANVFRLGRDQIRTINQILWRETYGNTHRIVVPAGVTYEEENIRIEQVGNIFVEVLGIMRVTGTVFVYGSNIELMVNGGTFTASGSVAFTLSSGFSFFTFRYLNDATMNVADKFVQTGYSPNLVILSGMPEGMTLKVTDYDRANGAFIGNYLLRDF